MDNIFLADSEIIIGINWGAIEEKGWFDATDYIGVDLDLSCIIIDSENEIKSVHNWQNKETDVIDLSSDDNYGDIKGNDHLDNEYATISLKMVSDNEEIILYVNNYTEQELGKLSHFDYRVYNGSPNKPRETFLFRDLHSIHEYDKSHGILLGRIYNDYKNWKYESIEKCLLYSKKEIEKNVLETYINQLI